MVSACVVASFSGRPTGIRSFLDCLQVTAGPITLNARGQPDFWAFISTCSSSSDAGAPWRELVELDLEFHQLIASLSRNEIRTAISLGINRIVRGASLALEGTVDSADEAAELLAVATAIEQADRPGAYEAMMAHVGSNSALEVRAVENQHLELNDTTETK